MWQDGGPEACVRDTWVLELRDMRLVRLAFLLGAAVLSAQATPQPLGLAGVQTPSTASAPPPTLARGRVDKEGVLRPRRDRGVKSY